MAWAASMTALSPDPQTLLMVMAGTEAGIPPRMAACRAGACPPPAPTTFPMITSSTAPGSIPALLTASRTVRAPSSVAGSVERPPRNRPMGVRTPERITGVLALSVMGPHLPFLLGSAGSRI